MYQMICPDLEGLPWEDFDAADRACTGTEIGEVRGDLRTHDGAAVKPA